MYMTFRAGKVLVATILLVYGSTVFAELKASYARTTPKKDDPHNEIDQQDFQLEYKNMFYLAEDQRFNLVSGGKLETKSWEFDDSSLKDVDLVKIKVPLTSTNVLENNKVFTATITPGLHGEADEFSSSDFRVEAQAMMLWLRGHHQWLLGVGFSDIFGEPQLFPILGTIWSISERVQLNLIFPSLGASYKASDTISYLVSVEPAGGQWTYEAGDVGNQRAVDLALQGTRAGLGMQWHVNKGNALTLKAGIETDREVKVSRHSDPDINASLELEDAWFIYLDYAYK